MNVVLIPAAGVGKRMGSDLPKQFAPLAGIPILARTLGCFQASSLVDMIFVAAQPDHFSRIRDIATEHGITKMQEIVEGGAQRQDSVWNALKAAPPIADIVMVHDAVRPLVTDAEIQLVAGAAMRSGAAILGVRVKDTIKQSDENGFVENTLDREYLWAAQTPQAFKREILYNAFRHANSDHFLATDEASLVEYSGGDVQIVEGSYANIKITTNEDLLVAEAILAARVPH